MLSNSEGGLDAPARARRAAGRGGASGGPTRSSSRPQPVEKEMDVFFYGYGDKFRREWMAAMVGEPSRTRPSIDFALGGRDFQGDIGRAREIGDVPFNVFARAISAARVNLNVTRRSHATVDGLVDVPAVRARLGGRRDRLEPARGASSAGSSRAARCSSSRTRTRRSPPTGRCSTIPAQAEAMGARARERVLDEHTYAHRARRVLELLGLERGGARVTGARIVAIVPAFNEEAAIGGVVEEIRAFDPAFDVVVIDDGSTDATADAAARAGAAVVRLPVQPRHRRRRPDGLQVRARARLRRRGAARRRRPARRRRAPEAARAARARRGRHRHRLAVRRGRRTATGRRFAGGSGSRGSRASSRC